MPGVAGPLELENVRDEVLREIASRGQVRKFQRNAVISQEGDQGDSFYVVLSGKVKVYASDDNGREVILDVLGPGEYVGEMTLDGGPRAASVMTLEPSTFAVLGLADLREHIARNPGLAIYLITKLIKRTRKATNNIKTLALMDVYGRVARLLLSLAVEREGKLVGPEWPTQQEVAERIGSSREMISRIMKDLAVGGYIEIRGRTITMNRPPPAHW